MVEIGGFNMMSPSHFPVRVYPGLSLSSEPILPRPNDPFGPDNLPPLYCRDRRFLLRPTDTVGPALWRYSLILHLRDKGKVPDRDSGREGRSGSKQGPDGESFDDMGRPTSPSRRGGDDGIGWGGERGWDSDRDDGGSRGEF